VKQVEFARLVGMLPVVGAEMMKRLTLELVGKSPTVLLDVTGNEAPIRVV